MLMTRRSRIHRDEQHEDSHNEFYFMMVVYVYLLLLIIIILLVVGIHHIICTLIGKEKRGKHILNESSITNL